MIGKDELLVIGAAGASAIMNLSWYKLVENEPVLVTSKTWQEIIAVIIISIPPIILAICVALAALRKTPPGAISKLTADDIKKLIEETQKSKENNA